MAAKEPTVERRHELLAEEAIDAGCVGYFTEIRAGMVDQLRRSVAQAIANAEAQGLANRDERSRQEMTDQQNDDLKLIRDALLGGTTGRLHGEEESECFDALVALDRIKAALAVERASNTANMAELLRADELLGVERARVAEYKASEADWREQLRALESKLPTSVRAELGEYPEGEIDNDTLEFGCCPGDSAALLKLRQAIDDAGAWPSDEAREAGDYEAAVAFMAGRLTEQQAEHERVIRELERMRENNDRTWRNGGANLADYLSKHPDTVPGAYVPAEAVRLLKAADALVADLNSQLATERHIVDAYIDKLKAAEVEHTRVVAELEESGRVKARALAERDALRLRIAETEKVTVTEHVWSDPTPSPALPVGQGEDRPQRECHDNPRSVEGIARDGNRCQCAGCWPNWPNPEPHAPGEMVTHRQLAAFRAELVESLRYIATANDADTAPRHIAWQLLASRLERKAGKS